MNAPKEIFLNDLGFSTVPTPDRCHEIVRATASRYKRGYDPRPTLFYTTNTPEYAGHYKGLFDLSGNSESRGFGIPDSELRRRFVRYGKETEIPINDSDLFKVVPCREEQMAKISTFMEEQRWRPETKAANGTVIPIGRALRATQNRWGKAKGGARRKQNTRRHQRKR